MCHSYNKDADNRINRKYSYRRPAFRISWNFPWFCLRCSGLSMQRVLSHAYCFSCGYRCNYSWRQWFRSGLCRDSLLRVRVRTDALKHVSGCFRIQWCESGCQWHFGQWPNWHRHCSLQCYTRKRRLYTKSIQRYNLPSFLWFCRSPARWPMLFPGWSTTFCGIGHERYKVYSPWYFLFS